MSRKQLFILSILEFLIENKFANELLNSNYSNNGLIVSYAWENVEEYEEYNNLTINSVE